ncbi:MAG: hypothetical protein J6B71_02860, partial [Clostridia bacterium]|nr:hypothetical protein [Clostridia bacterium]
MLARFPFSKLSLNFLLWLDKVHRQTVGADEKAYTFFSRRRDHQPCHPSRKSIFDEGKNAFHLPLATKRDVGDVAP